MPGARTVCSGKSGICIGLRQPNGNAAGGAGGVR